MCAQPPPYGQICQAYLQPNLDNDLFRQTSLKDFYHVQQNTTLSRFQEYIPMGSSGYEMALYGLGLIDVEVNGLFGELDDSCPSDLNLNQLASVNGFLGETIVGADHMDLISNNSASFVDLLRA